VTRQILEVLCEHADLSVVIITKSPLVTRDIDLLSRLNRHSRVSVHLTLTTIDRELCRRIEPRAPTPEARLRALVRLREAGIDAGINCMPVLPGITDNPSALEALVERAAAAGATYVHACALRLQSEARKRYLPFIDKEFPHLSARYRNTYAHDHNAGERYRDGLEKFFDRLCRKHKVRGYIYDPARTDDEERESTAEAIAEHVEPARAAEQLVLEV
jgi:DNA repair photolyase